MSKISQGTVHGLFGISWTVEEIVGDELFDEDIYELDDDEAAAEALVNRKPTALELADAEATARLLANGDEAYLRELLAEVAAASVTYRRLEILQVIFSLVERGLLVDTGERRGGRIVWAATHS